MYLQRIYLMEMEKKNEDLIRQRYKNWIEWKIYWNNKNQNKENYRTNLSVYVAWCCNKKRTKCSDQALFIFVSK